MKALHRFTAFMLTLILILSILPLTAFAADNNTPNTNNGPYDHSGPYIEPSAELEALMAMDPADMTLTQFHTLCKYAMNNIDWTNLNGKTGMAKGYNVIKNYDSQADSLFESNATWKANVVPYVQDELNNYYSHAWDYYRTFPYTDEDSMFQLINLVETYRPDLRYKSDGEPRDFWYEPYPYGTLIINDGDVYDSYTSINYIIRTKAPELVEPLDTTELETVLAHAKTIDTSHYEPQWSYDRTVADFNDAIEEADFRLGNTDRYFSWSDTTGYGTAIRQCQIDNLVTRLTVLMERMNAVYDGRADLEALVAECQALNADNYTADSWAVLQTALATAIADLADPNASDETLTADFNNLLAAKNNLVVLTNFDRLLLQLQNLIAYAKTIDLSLYTPESAEWLPYEIQTAETLIAEIDTYSDPEQQLQEELGWLQQAIDSLVPLPVDVDTTALEAAIAQAQAIDLSPYTTASANALTEAINNGIAVLANPTSQQQINDATTAILTAIDNLAIQYGDSTALAALVEQANTLNEADYMPDNWDAFTEALATATALLNGDHFQNEYDEAYTALQNAMNALVPVGDPTALNELIAQAEALNETDYMPDNWNAFITALTNAQALQTGKHLQNEYDEASNMLQAAMNALIHVGDPTALNNLIAEAELLVDTDYMPNSWNAFVTALADAKILQNGKHIQSDYDAAYSTLQTAIDNLVHVGDPSALNQLINSALLLDSEDYTTESFAAVTEALTAAQELQNGPHTQAEYDTAYTTLQTAIANLVFVSGYGNPTALNTLIEQAEQLVETDYTSATWPAFAEALANAKALQTGDHFQNEYDEAYEALQTAMDALIRVGDPTALNELIAQAEALNEADYVPDNWGAFVAALADAKALQTGKHIQAEYDAAYTALQNAMGALVSIYGTPDALAALVAQAEQLVEADYTAESWGPFAEALAAAKALLEGQHMQGEYDAAEAALQAAMDSLVRVLVNPFVDVEPGTYYYDAVLWAVNTDPQITSGTSATTFSPKDKCTRCEVVTFLWRAAGQPEPTATRNPFTDVKESAFYYKAVLWAVEKGITQGTSRTTFSPMRECSRSEVVTFLWRAADCPEPTSTRNPFTDVKESDFFYKAVLWAVEEGITKGTSGTTFAPKNICTRSEVVTFLYRAMGDE